MTHTDPRSYDGLGPMFTEDDFPPGSDRRKAFIARAARHPIPPFAGIVPVDQLLDGAGDYDDDWSELEHSLYNGSEEGDMCRVVKWRAWTVPESIKVLEP